MKMKKNVYDEQFYKINRTSYHSAKLIMPLVLSVLGRVDSVIDLGCGAGHWLLACKELGAEKILGVDGDYVIREQMYIPQENFMPYNLTKTLDLKEKFDLAISLEVAEHLSADYAQTFVDSLCRHSDTVLFSAAIPGQTGAHHVNEQLPSYWAELFGKNGYVPIDCIRPQIWGNKDIDIWYRQNVLLYVKLSSLRRIEEKLTSKHIIMDIIHPDTLYDYSSFSLRRLWNMQREIVKVLPKTIAKKLRR